MDPVVQGQLLEQYKVYVEMADHISERRTSANNYLLAVNTALLTADGVSLAVLPGYAWPLQCLIAVVGLLVSLTWFTVIRSYRQLNTVKFQVIHELETRLPSDPYTREWKLAEEGRGHAYLPLTHVEPFVPLAFVVLYVGLAIIALV